MRPFTAGGHSTRRDRSRLSDRIGGRLASTARAQPSPAASRPWSVGYDCSGLIMMAYRAAGSRCRVRPSSRCMPGGRFTRSATSCRGTCCLPLAPTARLRIRARRHVHRLRAGHSGGHHPGRRRYPAGGDRCYCAGPPRAIDGSLGFRRLTHVVHAVSGNRLRGRGPTRRTSARGGPGSRAPRRWRARRAAGARSRGPGGRARRSARAAA
jgi:hypothetical protein